MDDLVRLAGIWPSYIDVHQAECTPPPSTISSLLKSLGFSNETPEATAESLERLRAYKEPVFAPVRVIEAHRQSRIDAPRVTAWELRDEAGEVSWGVAVRGAIVLPPLKPGYYDLLVKHPAGDSHCFLIVPPDRCWKPESLEKGKRVWGVSTQLYSMRSSTNFGMGDFTDLGTFVKLIAERGGDVIGLNPVHALFPSDSGRFGPYDPSNRLFLNMLYIDVTSIDGFDACPEVKELWADKAFQEKLARAREVELVDYALVSEIKLALLRPLHHYFLKNGEHENYEKFAAEFGRRLHRHALFDALSEHFFAERGIPESWHHWPEAYHAPSTPEVASFAAQNEQVIEFYVWLQWISDNQLARAQNLALQAGMEIGLCRDLAVGAGGSGAEAWADPSSFIQGARIGVPPDEFNPRGQNWGLCTFNPHRLRETRYEAFIALLRGNMRNCRALRIDHAFGLSRMFMIPDGKTPPEGTFLDFPFDELLAILRLESHRHQCMVIGEDLGTFPPNYRDAAVKTGLLSYKVMWFEHAPGGGFLRPQFYDPNSLATFSTHDLPTLEGWFKGADIEEKQQLNIYPSEELLHRDRWMRERDKGDIAEALKDIGDGTDMPVADRIQLFLAETPCALVLMQIEDLLGIVKQVNVPATTTERPNWRIKLPVSLDDIAADAHIRQLAQQMTEVRRRPLIDYPRATYRLQFHKDFTFYDAAKIVPYLAKLGISHLYASPYMQARPGSKHGYDIVAYDKLNPELGGEEGYQVLCDALDAHGLKQLLDFVPNHMGVGGAENAWWLSVLEWGRHSPYAGYFDITWESPIAGEVAKIIVPFLDDHYGDVLDRGDLKLAFNPEDGSYSVWYHQHRFSICPKDYHFIFEAIPQIETYEEGERLKGDLAHNHGWHKELQSVAEEFTRDPHHVHALLDRQHYRLAFWRVASNDINFRRFFNINDLAGVRVENRNLFQAMHKLVFELLRTRKVHGLRIDHVDGLADPAAYCTALKREAGSSLYLVTEKILGADEKIPPLWNIEGTTGYDALNQIGGVFIDQRGLKPLDKTYRAFSGLTIAWEDMAHEAKLSILDTTLASELRALTLLLKRIAEHSPYTRDYPFETLRRVLKEIIGWFSVYRTYADPDRVSEEDARIIHSAVNRAKKRSVLPDRSAYDFIGALLTFEDAVAEPIVVTFVRKLQQLTGAVMAKGVEDTSFYCFARLLSLNEVGGSPERFGVSTRMFHQIMKTRCEIQPHSMLATATHDTKRGEDMRMRLHVLSERPLLWRQCLRRWAQINRSCRSAEDDGSPIPSANDEYFIYQTLLGSWPNELLAAPLDDHALKAYLKRIEDYLIKAIREAKIHSDWDNPDKPYEEGVVKFLRQILDPVRRNSFLEDFVPIAKSLAPVGMINSLAQVALKLTLPGVPDLYQGTDLWDYNLVDPDNRRPVDYGRLETMLESNETLAAQLKHWEDGAVKQHLIHRLLQHRAAHSDLYSFGDYQPLEATGSRAERVLGFTRSYGNQKLIVAVPVLSGGKMTKGLSFPLKLYAETKLEIPKGQYQNIITGNGVTTKGNILDLARDFPVIVLSS